METFAAGSENESPKIHINQEKCETESRSSSYLNIRQSTSWSLNSLKNCCTGLLSPCRSRKSKNTSDISRSQVQWHRPVTNCMFDSHFKNTNRSEEFHIDQLIAKGAFGCVFKVYPKNNRNKSFALKTIRKSKVIRDSCVQQIKDEADIQKLCGHHPFIVQHSDSWQDRRQLYILSEYVSNGELFSKLCKFTTELIRLYTAEIALAIDFLHNAGVIYRDAKPENILLTSNYHIKITDFGLSKWLKIGDKTRTMCGTHQYMAPEILRNEPYGHSVDWWALGVIICQMYTTKCPDTKGFLATMASTESNLQSTLSIKQFLPDETESIPLDGKDMLLRLLDINPRTRLHSVMGLQRIALYKNFKLNLNYVQNISPKDIISREKIPIKPSNEEAFIDFNI